MDHKHNQQNTCQYCPPKSNEPILTSGAKTKLTSFFGVCGCVSCYVAMFPAILLWIIGIFGISRSATLSGLNAYMGSALFQPILILSILFLVAGIMRYGTQPIVLSALGGIGVFVSMNFYMRGWLFTLSFIFILLAYLLAFIKTKAPQFKFALIFLAMVIILGVIDVGRVAFSSPNPQKNTIPQQQTPPSMRQMQ